MDSIGEILAELYWNVPSLVIRCIVGCLGRSNVISALSVLLFPVAIPYNQDLTVPCHWILEALTVQLDLCSCLLLSTPKVKAVGFRLFNSLLLNIYCNKKINNF